MNSIEWHDIKWIISYIFILSYLLLFIAISLIIQPYWIEIDTFLGDALGLHVDYVFGIVILASAAISYPLLLIVIGLTNIKSHKGFSPGIMNKIIPSILLIVFVLFLLLLGLLWGDDASLIFSAFEYLSPVLFFVMIFSVTVFLKSGIYSMIRIFHGIKEKAIHISSRKSLTSILFLTLCGAIYLSPFVFVPANAVQGSLPTKPNLIGHRCSSSLGPENTLETAQTALSFGIIGIEVDIQISIDGIPFLLHDDTFERTTNVDTLFPERASERASSFLISEIRQLDAGSWFVQTDPFDTISSSVISESQAENYRSAQIPTLAETVEFVEQENLILNTDFKYPLEDHPLYETYLNICLSVIQEANIENHVWITSWDQESLNEIKSKYPEMQSVLSVGPNSAPSSFDFIEMDFDMINTHHGLSNGLFTNYDKSGISVNAWTVNSIPRFSQLWCVGVDFVTTDNPQDFHNLEYPYWYLSFPVHTSIWIILDIVCIIIIALSYRCFFAFS